MATEGQIWLLLRSISFSSEQVARNGQQAWKEDLILGTSRDDSKQCRKIMINIAGKRNISRRFEHISVRVTSHQVRETNKKRDKCEQPM